MERFRYKSFTIGRYQNRFGNYYLIEPTEDTEDTYKLDGFTITTDIRESFKIPIVFENYKGLYVKTDKKEFSFTSDNTSNVKCGPLFYLSQTLIGPKIDLSNFPEHKILYDNFRIEPTGKFICLTENPNSIKWSKSLLLSQINVLPETYLKSYEIDGYIIYIIPNPMPIIEKISDREINEKTYHVNNTLIEISRNKAKRLLNDIDALNIKVRGWVTNPNPNVINIETDISEFTRKILGM